MAAENDIIIKITGEADLDAAQKQLQELTKRSEDYEKQIEQLKKAEKADAQSLKETITDQKALAKALERNADYYREERKAVKDATTANKQNIKALTDQVKAYKTLHGQSGRMVQQLRAMREELQRMEDAGEFGSQAFIDLSIAAGKLEDQIGDTQQRIRILASDTKEMDALMGLGDGLAGTFYIATSAAEILGDDMEGLQRAFYKVQAAMSIVSGAQQVWNALNKDSAAMVVINTALTKLFGKSKKESAVATAADAASSTADVGAKTAEAIATESAAKAQWSLNAAFKANPIGLILAGVVAITAAIYAAYKIFDKTERRVRAARKEYEKVSTSTEYYLIKWAQTHETTMRDIDERERNSLNEKKKRHASDLEIQKEELSFLKERSKEMLEYSNKAIVQNNKEIAASREFVEAKLDEYNKTKPGSEKRQEALKALTEAEEQYNNAVSTGRQLADERTQAMQAVTDKELEIEETRRQLRQQAQQAQIEIMRDGQAKEIAQINASYEEQLRTITGNSKEERALRKALKEKQAQEIADVERKYAIETQKTLTEIDVQAMEERTKALKGNEGVEGQLKVWGDYYRSREYQIDENARLEIEEINRSTDNEEVKEARIKKVQQQAQADRTALAREEAEKRIEINNQEVSALELAADKAAHAMDQAQPGGKLDALKANLDAQLALYSAQQDQLKAQYDAGLISYQDYKQQEWEIEKATIDAEVQYRQNAMQTIADGFQTALGYMQQISDMAFEAINQNIQAQMDALDEEYTTDWEEAQKNANKKYITEKEYEKKKADLEMKQAKYAKAQALTNIGIQTALAIITTLAQLGATPWGIASAAIAGAMGAAQLAIAAAKPLSQYEKGRKGGPGEYALVGEKGPELMYVPAGASIVPNDKIATPAAWAQFGVPELPHANPDTLRYASDQTAAGYSIDYDRLGAAVAAALPKQRNNNVTVNVDRHGVHVLDGGGRHTYLNTKYNGSWN